LRPAQGAGIASQAAVRSAVRAPRWAWLVSTGFGSGRLRPAPGTWGSLTGLIAWCLLSLLLATPFSNWVAAHRDAAWLGYRIYAAEGVFLLAPLAMSWLAVRAADHVLRETGAKDPSYIVADEWAGMWITLWPLRWEIAQHLHRLVGPGGWRWLPALLVPFLAFRLFDVWKPWPVRQIQDLPGATGVVADDVVAGLYAIPVVMLAAPLVLNNLAR
jgi:phosphatidylglycerophosphatase A